MNNYFSRYCALISSKEQLDYCRQAKILSELLARIKTLWNCQDLGDNKLLNEILSLNQTPITTSTVSLAGIWLPYRYQAKQGLVNWLLPIDHATQPFFDEYISHCRQQLLNQIIQPCTSLFVAQQQANNIDHIQPAGFIFHLSRCGSTLISGCLSELESTCVFSESPLLTELLVDGNLSVDEQKTYLIAFINLQSAAFPNRPNMIIKWNAWDIFRWKIISEIYPQVPVVFLVRNPVEILASHHRLAGRHMAGDKSLVNVHYVFDEFFNTASEVLLARRTKVLAALLLEMNKIDKNEGILCMDYRSLDIEGISKICFHFGLCSDMEQISARLKFHSKSPQIIFFNDVQTKQQVFSSEDKNCIQQLLLPLYGQFLKDTILKGTIFEEEHNAC